MLSILSLYISDLQCIDQVKRGDSIEDTDCLNSDISLLALCLLKKYVPKFSAFDLSSSSVLSNGLLSRPPCRWETRSVTIPFADAVAFEKLHSSVSVGQPYFDDTAGVSRSALSDSVGDGPSNQVINVGLVATNGDKGVSSAANTINSSSDIHREHISVEVVMDMGHNPAAIEALTRKIRNKLAGKSVIRYSEEYY